MINNESKTLREFSAPFVSKNSKLTVFFGYDTAANHSGFYIDGALNNGIRTSSTAMISRIRELGIELFDRIIDAVGTDVYGLRADFDTESKKIVDRCIADAVQIEDVDAFYRLDSDDSCPDCVALSAMIDAYEIAKTEKAKLAILTKFNNSQRTRLIGLTRDIIRDVREACFNGISSLTETVPVSYEGLLRKTSNPAYYKRDIDYVRKARVRLFKNVLKRKYKPCVD